MGESVTIQGKTFRPGQVNNVYIFPGVSMGAICCQARTIPERLFMVAAEAVANSLDAQDLSFESVVPSRDKIRTCGLNVAAAVVFEAQNLGIAGKSLGKTIAEVKERVREMMWAPDVAIPHATAGAVDDLVAKQRLLQGIRHRSTSGSDGLERVLQDMNVAMLSAEAALIGHIDKEAGIKQLAEAKALMDEVLACVQQAKEWDHERRELLQQESGVSKQSPAAMASKLMQPIEKFAEDLMPMSDAAIGA